jgi:NIMA (never in mitosis gene a)-related kinase 1/4/5
VIAYKEAFIEEESECLCIIMEFADAGDLQQRVESFRKSGELVPEIEIWGVAFKVLMALKTLHKMKIVHRDIKAANIFISKKEDNSEECIEDMNIKLGDLNVSKIAKMGMMST